MATRVRLLVHGGAGGRAGETPDPDRERALAAALRASLAAGHGILVDGGSALDAVVAAVAVLEDAPELNAGRGSVLTADGRVQMDACAMDGPSGRAGAVAAVEELASAVAAARLVLERSPHVLLAGPDARAFALAHGAEPARAAWLATPARRRQLEAARARGALELDHDAGEGGGTVGAVALDRRGGLAAATSTGGVAGQLAGRVGDSPVPGAGTWADANVAVSATGTGERFLEACFAHEVAARMRLAGASLDEACREALAAVSARGGRGGCIALAADGRAALPFTTVRMLRGAIGSGIHQEAVGADGQPQVWT
jgi:beta-aspartyl-peptidase (threonine type)